jgi:hypothetical protein
MLVSMGWAYYFHVSSFNSSKITNLNAQNAISNIKSDVLSNSTEIISKFLLDAFRL